MFIRNKNDSLDSIIIWWLVESQCANALVDIFCTSFVYVWFLIQKMNI